MSIGKEEKLEQYSEEDRKLLVSLLNEYAEKLAGNCERIDKLLNQKDRLWLNIWVLATLIVGCISMIWVLETNRAFAWFLDSNSSTLLRIIISLPILISISAGLFFGLIIDGFRLPRIYSKKKVYLREAQIIARKLEKIVKIVSQMQEHGANRISSRIEMDLRLADAELVLEHYENLNRRNTALEVFSQALVTQIKR